MTPEEVQKLGLSRRGIRPGVGPTSPPRLASVPYSSLWRFCHFEKQLHLDRKLVALDEASRPSSSVLQGRMPLPKVCQIAY